MKPHTSGPWFIHEHKEQVHILDWEGKTAIAKIMRVRTDGRGAPNARLVAAAPDLLAALETAKVLLEASYLDHEGTPNGRAIFIGLEAAREAIAKATGGAS